MDMQTKDPSAPHYPPNPQLGSHYISVSSYPIMPENLAFRFLYRSYK